MLVSIIVPVLNEEPAITATIQALKEAPGSKEIIVVDGGSADRTVEVATQQGVKVINAPRGRGQQQSAGAAHASGEVLWFVHADTQVPWDALEQITAAVKAGALAGNFALIFDGKSYAARLLTRIYPLLRILRLCYGDSGIFVRRSAYDAVGGFRELPLFEDLDFLHRIRRAGRFVHLPCALVTSSRRFEKRNFLGIWLRWTALQLLYWCGISPVRLARWYKR